MSVLVTGGAGFIGSNLAEELLVRGSSVTVLDNLSTGRLANIAYLRKYPGFRFVKGNAEDPAIVEQLVSEAAAVFHLAAVVGVPRVCLEPAGTLEVNFGATQTVAEICRKYGVKMILASSSEAYGKNHAKPLKETDDTIIGPSSVPRWAYAVSKLADEYLVRGLMKDQPAVIIRYFNAYGPRMDPIGGSSVVATFIRQALLEQPLTIFGDGNQTRSFIYIQDTVAGTLAAAERPDSGLFNIGRPKETTVNELAEKIIMLSDSISVIEHCDPPPEWGEFEEQRQRLPSIASAQTQLGFKPTIDLENGLIRTIDWMRGELRVVKHLRRAG
jgi:UDP-glucose 4-epimerase